MRDKQLEDLKQQTLNFKSTISARDAQIKELEFLLQDAQKAIPIPTAKSGAVNGNGSNGSGNGNGNGKILANSRTNGNGHNHTNGSNGNIVHINGNGVAKNKNNGSTKIAKVSHLNSVNGTSTPKKAEVKRKMKSYGLSKPSRKPDDLKLISGVGIALEKTLHKLGIYYFEQIAGFTRKDVAAVDEKLKFKGRIDRDEWIKQAKILLRGGTYERKKAETKPTNTRPKIGKKRMKPLGMKRPKGELDDLQLINGVGPKLERKLHRLGVYHYEQIADFTAEDIELLDSKLKTYRGRVKRDKWPLQARRLHKEFYVSV